MSLNNSTESAEPKFVIPPSNISDNSNFDIGKTNISEDIGLLLDAELNSIHQQKLDKDQRKAEFAKLAEKFNLPYGIITNRSVFIHCQIIMRRSIQKQVQDISTAETAPPTAAPPAPPVTLPLNLDGIPEYLKQFRQWVLWKLVFDGKDWTKVPYQPNGDKAENDNPDTFSSFEEIEAAYATGEFDGIGFCFWEGDGLVGIDLDHCLDANGNLKDWAKVIVDQFRQTFIERSPTDGVHIWALGSPHDKEIYSKRTIKWDNPGHKKAQGVEIFDHTSHRYFTITGVPI